MAASKKRAERAAPSLDMGKSSRVSKAADASTKVRVEQRAGSAATARGNKNSTNKAVPPRRASANGKAAPKKGAPAGRSYTPNNQPNPPADSRFIGRVKKRWDAMEPHHQQRFFSILLLLLSLLLFGGLTIWKKAPVLGQIGDFFILFFGWGAYPLAIGLIVFAAAHLVEGLRNVRFIRWSLVLSLFAFLLLVLVESGLFVVGSGGVVGGLLGRPLVGWPGPVPHVIVIGLCLLAIILAFRVRLGHAHAVAGFIGKAFADRRAAGAGGASATPSPYLGQRPQYSRYMNNASPDAVPARGRAQNAAARPAARDDEEELDDDALIEFDADFEADDPRNDINLHKQQVGTVSRGQRPAVPLNREEYQAAVQGARQQPLPFDQANARQNDEREIEPLAPNPLHANQPKIVRRAANAPAAESPWKLPDPSILNNPEEVKAQVLGEDTTSLARIIQETLRSFRVEAEVRPEDISIGPTVIRFGIRPTGKPLVKQDDKGKLVPVKDASGGIIYEQRTRVSRIMALQNDLALVLEAKAIRMEAPVPGRPYVGVEIPNKNSRLVTLREILESKEYASARAKSKLAVALGKDVAGAVRVGDLARMPHLLIAGATGAGKSVSINAFIGSILMQATPEDVRLLMIDPKMVELNMYNGIPHLLAPVVTEVDRVVGLLKIAISEMEKRYRLFSQLNVRNLDGYRKLRVERMARGDNTLQNLPAIVIIIDELADLMMAAPEEVEGLICRLAQLARATGIHLMVATQRPSVDVITGLIKANIPTRISFMVSSAVDSRTIIDMGGAERLLGRGDMLYLPADAGKPERIQGAFVADDEAERLVSFWKQQYAEHMARAAAAANVGKAGAAPASSPPAVEPGWEVSDHLSDDFELDDELLEQAEQVVQDYERASISLLQRRLRIGYSRAARLIDLLEERGVISRMEPGGRSREVLEKRDRNDSGEGRTMADEAADIIAEEKARQEAIKKQQNQP